MNDHGSSVHHLQVAVKAVPEKKIVQKRTFIVYRNSINQKELFFILKGIVCKV